MGTVPVRGDLDLLSTNKVINAPNATADTDLATLGQVKAATEGLSWKDSVRVSTQGNLDLASPGATIDGITMAANDRFLARSQSTQSQNGIYIWNGAATPATRALDASTFPELEGAVVTVEEGTDAGATFRQTQVNGTIDTNNVVFTSFGTSAPSASETTAGIAEIATQSETDTGTDDLRIVTPLKLATHSGRKRKHAADIGDGSTTSFVVTHNFNTEDVQVTVYEKSGSKRVVMGEVQITGVNSVTVILTPAISSNSHRVVVIA